MSIDNSSFDEKAASWWDETGPFKMLHRINPVRLDFILKYAQTLVKKRVLDVGCGGGIFAEAAARQGAYVLGLDTSEASIEVAKLHAIKSDVSVDYKVCDLAKLSKKVAKFDLITCLEMLEHVEDPQAIIALMSHYLQEDGYIVVSTIHRSIISYLKLIVAAEYLLDWIPKGTHQYDYFIKPSELVAYGRRAQLEMVDIVGVDFVHESQSFVCTDQVSANYMAVFKKLS